MTRLIQKASSAALGFVIILLIGKALLLPILVFMELERERNFYRDLSLVLANEVIYLHNRIDYKWPTYGGGYKIKITKAHVDTFRAELKQIEATYMEK